MEYKKILEQRNALLKRENTAQNGFHLTMEILSEKLAGCAAQITKKRADYFKTAF